MDIVIITTAKEEVRQSSMKWDVVCTGETGQTSTGLFPRDKSGKNTKFVLAVRQRTREIDEC